MMGLFYLIVWLQSGCYAETPAIANPPGPVASTVPLYSPGDQPLENDIEQGATPDCFLEAVLGATARHYPTIITDLLQDQGDGTVPATYFAPSGTTVTESVEKKGFVKRIQSEDSAVCWIAVVQDTIQQFFKQVQSVSDVHNGRGGRRIGRVPSHLRMIE